MSKRMILSDSSLNSHGYRVLTEGIDLDAFERNPVMLYMHYRDEGSPFWGEYKAIGHWKDIRVEGDQLTAEPVFDLVGELSREIAAKFEAGTYRAASIGIRVLATSEEKEHLLPGQTRQTVTKSQLLEASIVDIPANSHAVRFYDRGDTALLSLKGEVCAVPELTKPTTNMNLKQSWKSILAFLGIQEESAEQTPLSEQDVESLNAELSRLQASQAASEETAQRQSAEVERLTAELALRDEETHTLKERVRELEEQVENLKRQPAASAATLSPSNEPAASGTPDDLQSFLNANEGDYAKVTARLREEGLIP